MVSPPTTASDIASKGHVRSSRVLVTAFGSFPGMPRNPTLRILDAVIRERGRFRRLGFELHTKILPVRYAGLAEALRDAAAVEPDVILLLGVAGRRRRVSVECRALNAANPLRYDAGGARPAARLMDGAPVTRAASWPAARIVAAIRALGVPVDLSRDAGGYVCNAALYHALHLRLAPVVGFLHVPRPREIGLHQLTRATIAAMLAARLRLS